MAYSAVDEVIVMLKEDMFNSIVGNEYIRDPEERREKLIPIAQGAIADADAEIDGYLMKRYPVPMMPTPFVINKYSKDIALYNMVSRAGIDTGDRESNYLTRYKNAISFLTNVAKGVTDVIVDGTSKAQAARNGFAMKNSKRLFSRESMKGM